MYYLPKDIRNHVSAGKYTPLFLGWVTKSALLSTSLGIIWESDGLFFAIFKNLKSIQEFNFNISSLRKICYQFYKELLQGFNLNLMYFVSNQLLFDNLLFISFFIRFSQFKDFNIFSFKFSE